VKFAIIIQVLGEMDGDVDAAIEYMIAERLAVSTNDAEVDPYMDHACNGKYHKLS
jgi:OTU domain-containing protein 3